VALLALLAASCGGARDEGAGTGRLAVTAGPTATDVARSTSRALAEDPATAVGAAANGDPDRGRALVLEYECNRCHDGTGQPAIATERHCTHCHEDIATGRFGAGTPRIAEWKRSVLPYRHAPTLDDLGKRLRPGWVARFVHEPYDVRPNLAATMPRLALDAGKAADLAAYLTRDAPRERDVALAGSAAAGRALMEAKGCGGCHVFSGVPALPSTPALGDAIRRTAAELAPDLRHTRDRFRRDALVPWLLAPSSLKPTTLMPSHSLTEREATDIATYVLETPLAPRDDTPVVKRLPLLARTVTYSEIERRVLAITCRHCHGDPDVAGGDGGPGNTGGFGFSPRGLDLSSYRSASAGLLGRDGERHSLFERTKDGTPLLVAALVARREEEAGRAPGDVRGMPLGLPSVGAEEVQLVETWIAQGRPR
jgi:cytochrome c551/c552